MDFWHAQMDEMARQRFNVLTLWNLHPFPTIVKLPEYPDIALNDAWGNREPFDLNFNMNGKAMSAPFKLAWTVCGGSIFFELRRYLDQRDPVYLGR